jgi:lysophospholipase L1-like esterase
MAQSNPIKFLALGDSYTIGESVKEEERWPEQLATALRAKGYAVDKPQIIATTGWRTDQLKKAIEDASLKPTYNLVSLLIGVNNQYQGKSAESYAPEFEGLLNMAIQPSDNRSNRKSPKRWMRSTRSIKKLQKKQVFPIST